MYTILDQLKILSSKMGQDTSLIQYTGGNTSLKEDGILWVKASGKNLANALLEDVFVPLDLAQVVEEISSHNVDSNPSFLSLSNNSLRPSIETTLHALLPHQVVFHCHSIDVISISMLQESHIFLEEVLSDLPWHWIPYQRPGKPLTLAIAAALARKPADILVLANHGLVVGASNPEEAFALQADVTTRLRQVPRSYSKANEEELSRWLDMIVGARLPHASVIHSIATDPYSLDLAQRNPPYPDHVVFCGVHPWLVTASALPPPIDAKYGLIPGVGVILLASANAATEAMLQAQAEVYLRLPPGRNVNLLSHEQCTELLNWDAEKYRQVTGKVL